MLVPASRHDGRFEVGSTVDWIFVYTTVTRTESNHDSWNTGVLVVLAMACPPPVCVDQTINPPPNSTSAQLKHPFDADERNEHAIVQRKKTTQACAASLPTCVSHPTRRSPSYPDEAHGYPHNDRIIPPAIASKTATRRVALTSHGPSPLWHCPLQQPSAASPGLLRH